MFRRNVLGRIFKTQPDSYASFVRRIVAERRYREWYAEAPDEYAVFDKAVSHFGASEHGPLRRGAELLQLSYRSSITVPGADLMRAAGLEQEAMRRYRVVPQRATSFCAPYCLAIADPWRLALDEFHALGVEIALAAPGAIDHAWEQYERAQREAEMSLSRAQIHELLRRLMKDAARCGASEVVIGAKDNGLYEFIVDETRFEGGIHPGLLRNVLQECRMAGGRWTSVDEDVEYIATSLGSGAQGPVLFRWERSAPRNLVAVPSENRPQAHIAASVPVNSTTRILLIEDDERFSLVLSKLLAGRGYAVTRRTNGLEGLASVQDPDEEYELIICDVHMPRLDGVSFVSRLRELGLSLPTIMLTSDDSDELEVELASCGADIVIRKQTDPKVLLAWVSRLTNKGVIAETTEQYVNGASRSVA